MAAGKKNNVPLQEQLQSLVLKEVWCFWESWRWAPGNWGLWLFPELTAIVGTQLLSDSSFLPLNNHLNLRKEQWWCFRPRNFQGFLHSTHQYVKGNAILDFCHGAIRPNQDLVILMIAVSYNPMSKVYQLLRKGKNVHIYIYTYTLLVPGEARFLRSIQCDSIVAMILRVVNQTCKKMAWEKKRVYHCPEIATLVLFEPFVLVFTHPLWTCHDWDCSLWGLEGFIAFLFCWWRSGGGEIRVWMLVIEKDFRNNRQKKRSQIYIS